MPTVFLPALLRPLAGDRESIDVDGSNLRQVVDNLETKCPGVKERLLDQGRLKKTVSVAVDGEISPLGLLEEVRPDSEVHFVLALSGGATG